MLSTQEANLLLDQYIPVVYQANSDYRREIDAFRGAGSYFAATSISDHQVSMKYHHNTQRVALDLQEAVRSGRMSVESAAEEASAMRNTS